MNNNHKDCPWIIRYNRGGFPMLYCKDHGHYIKTLSADDADRLKHQGVEMAPVQIDISKFFDEE